ncbi:ABC transporter permease [Pseudooceanicola lipolyticus]|uniref:ABC transporter permease n=1 Tax=Pseudooceanicola lipolyticus TaxID=2029104 RepID=A0A2M8J1R1_9RHOB|nr:ABC transporter permease [Pseudooceanicola lipolyticus]PJE36704.1 ABC transporter permease [Pseudooceanicola lipolyticus]
MRSLRHFARNRGGFIGLVVLVVIIGCALSAPLLFPQSPWRMVARPMIPPEVFSGRYLFGTDVLGRDVASAVFHGARASLIVGLVATVVSLLIGVPIGAMAGYFGGWADDILMRVTEFFQTIPAFALSIVIVAILEPSFLSIIMAISIVSWPPVARLVRGEVLSLRSREYVQAAIVIGQTSTRILFTQVLPNVIAPLIVMASLMVGSSILLESALSFLGLGDPDMMTWGYVVGAGRTRLLDGWWISFFPGVAILLTVLALNLVGEGLNDFLNPRLKERGRK